MSDELALAFEQERPRLRAVAYRMLGTLADADDAVQEAWLRLSRGHDEIRNLSAWLTTVVGRVALDMLRARRETPLDPTTALVTAWPEPLLSPPDGIDPEQRALVADAVGVALMIVLETLTPAERLAFVMHDLFGVPFAEVGRLLDRSEDAAKMLASRARRRVRGAAPPAADLDRQRQVVDAFRAAAQQGDFAALLAVLHPDVVLRADVDQAGARGAEAVAQRALSFAALAPAGRPVLVNGAPGVLVAPGGRPVSLLAFTVQDGLITRLDILVDPVRLAGLDLADLA